MKYWLSDFLAHTVICVTVLLVCVFVVVCLFVFDDFTAISFFPILFGGIAAIVLLGEWIARKIERWGNS
jgi:hypothetical protein